MRMTLDLLEKQILQASVAYYKQDLETFFLPAEGDKTLDELIEQYTGFTAKRVSSYCYGQMIEFDMINYRDRLKKVLDFKIKVSVNYTMVDGVCEKVTVEFGI